MIPMAASSGDIGPYPFTGLSAWGGDVTKEDLFRALQRYETLVATVSQMLWVADPQGRVIEHSPSWEQVTGLSWEGVQGAGWLTSAHPEDREELSKRWFQAVAEVPELFEHLYRLRHADGTYRHCRIRAVPVFKSGFVLEWVSACTDVEDEWLRERRAGLLGNAAHAVAEPLEAPDAFAALNNLIVPALADECGIYLLSDVAIMKPVEEPLALRRAASTARAGLPEGLPPRREEFVEPHHALARAVHGRAEQYGTFPPGEVPDDFAPPGVGPWLERTRAHSVAVLPVLVDGTVAAVIAAFTCGDRAPIGADDRQLMRELVELAHNSLSRVLKLQHAQRFSRQLQYSLLTPPLAAPGMRIAARYVPSPMAAEVGGDWYDAFTLPDGAVMLVIGDVAGHDLPAAVTMSKMRNMLRGLAVDRLEPPGDILRRLDMSTRILDPEAGTSTCVLASVEDDGSGGHQLRYSVAGHPPPLLIAPGSPGRFLTGAQDIMLGGPLPEDPRSSTVHPLPPGSTLLLYTDGLTERRHEDPDQGLDRLRHHAITLTDEPVETFCDRILVDAAISEQDDIALIALRLPLSNEDF